MAPLSVWTSISKMFRISTYKTWTLCFRWWGKPFIPFLKVLLLLTNFLFGFWAHCFIFLLFSLGTFRAFFKDFCIFFLELSRLPILLWSVDYIFAKAKVLLFERTLNCSLRAFSRIIICVYLILGPTPNPIWLTVDCCHPNSISLPNCLGGFLRCLFPISS